MLWRGGRLDPPPVCRKAGHQQGLWALPVAHWPGPREPPPPRAAGPLQGHVQVCVSAGRQRAHVTSEDPEQEDAAPDTWVRCRPGAHGRAHTGCPREGGSSRGQLDTRRSTALLSFCARPGHTGKRLVPNWESLLRGFQKPNFS